MSAVTISAETERALINGYKHAAQATSASDPEILAQEMRQAVQYLKPIAPPEFCVPKASFGLGLLAEHMAKRMLVNPDLSEEKRQGLASKFFHEAAEYYEIAASMPDGQHDFMPARAKNSLADLYFLGRLDNKDEVKAFELWESAAEDGFAEAQINVAVRCYRGEGTEKSLPNALSWMEKASDNKSQLPPHLQDGVAEMLGMLQQEARQDLQPAKRDPHYVPGLY